MFAMRADSTFGRIIGALARTSPAETQAQTYGLDRQSGLGLVVSALARESIAASAVAPRNAATIALIESRATARAFLGRAVHDCGPVWDAYSRLEGMSKRAGISNLQDSIHGVPREQGKSGKGGEVLSLKKVDTQRILTELLMLLLVYLLEVRRLKRLIRHGDPSIYANFIADEIVSKLDAGVRQVRSLSRLLFEVTFLYRGPTFLGLYSINDESLATQLRTAVLAFGHTVRDLMAFATSSVDATNADLSGLRKLKRHQLAGVEWTNGTTWPPSLRSHVAAWSSEIREGVFMIVEGNSERDPSLFALT